MFHIRKRTSKRKDKKGKFKNRYQAIVNMYRNGRKFYKAQTFDSEKAATEWGADFLSQIRGGAITTESLKRRTLSDAIKKYIEIVLPSKPKNAKNVTQHLKWWDQEIGHLLLSEVTQPVVAACRDRLLAGITYKGTQRSSTTTVRYLASLSVVFETAIQDWMWISQNPVRQIRKPSIKTKRTSIFSLEEIDKIKELCTVVDSPHLPLIVQIAFGTTMRKGEILGLRWSHVDFKNRLLLLDDSKNGEPRNVPMSDTIYDMLNKRITDTQPALNALLFPSPHNPKKPICIRSAWERVLKLAGIQGKTFHTTRHTSISLLSAQGFTGIIISRLSGHSDDRVTNKVYTHMAPPSAREMVNTLDLLINKKGPNEPRPKRS